MSQVDLIAVPMWIVAGCQVFKIILKLLDRNKPVIQTVKRWQDKIRK